MGGIEKLMPSMGGGDCRGEWWKGGMEKLMDIEEMRITRMKEQEVRIRREMRR